MGDEAQDWDELMGPSPDQLKSMLAMDEPPPKPEPPAPVLRSKSSRAAPRGSPPPSSAFGGAGMGGTMGGTMGGVADRWAQHEPQGDEIKDATRRAVATARHAYGGAGSEEAEGLMLDNSNNSHRASSVCSGRSSLQFEDEEYYGGDTEPESFEQEEAVEVEADDSTRIRQEALRMLEVADDQLADTPYSVHRTKSGGFMATARSMGNQKRVPTALAGLATRATSTASTARTSITTSSGSRRSSTRGHRNSTTRRSSGYRDDPSSEDDSISSRSMNANDPITREDYEYGDERVVDVVGMEKRFASSRAEDAAAPKKSSGNWSSRYSIDDTMLALSGGASKSGGGGNSKFLDKLDKEHQDRTARGNLFGSSPAEARNTQVFGSGFSFRQKHVFGKQGVVAEKQENLRTVWMDAVPTAPSADKQPARSWQEQLTLKRKQRRNYILAAGALLIFIIIMAASLSSHKNKKESAAAAAAAASATSTASSSPSLPQPRVQVPPPAASDDPEEAMTFYVTSDVPLDAAGELQLMSDLEAVSEVADFIVHLGNIQNATESGCDTQRYGEVADILEASPVTVFMVPGEEDWSNCPDQDAAWDAWYNNFVGFDDRFDNKPMRTVKRQHDYNENFAFVDSGVLFVGVHEVNGEIYDYEELRYRNQANFRWIAENGSKHRHEIRAMIILANGRPLLESNDDFYAPLGDFLYMFEVPTAYIHANDGNGEDQMIYSLFEYEGMDHVIAIQTSKGQTKAPLRIIVGFSEENPFIIKWEQD